MKVVSSGRIGSRLIIGMDGSASCDSPYPTPASDEHLSQVCGDTPQLPRFCGFINVKLREETPSLSSCSFLTLQKWRAQDFLKTEVKGKKDKGKVTWGSAT